MADVHEQPIQVVPMHPARTSVTHNGDINMTAENNNDATTKSPRPYQDCGKTVCRVRQFCYCEGESETKELDQKTIDEIRRIVRKHIVATMITVEDDGNWVIDMVTEADA